MLITRTDKLYYIINALLINRLSHLSFFTVYKLSRPIYVYILYTILRPLTLNQQLTLNHILNQRSIMIFNFIFSIKYSNKKLINKYWNYILLFYYYN